MSSETINPSQSQLRSLLPVSRPSVAKRSTSSKSDTFIGYEKYHISIWKIAGLAVSSCQPRNGNRSGWKHRRQDNANNLFSSSPACSFDKRSCSPTYFLRDPGFGRHKFWGEPRKQPD